MLYIAVILILLGLILIWRAFLLSAAAEKPKLQKPAFYKPFRPLKVLKPPKALSQPLPKAQPPPLPRKTKAHFRPNAQVIPSPPPVVSSPDSIRLQGFFYLDVGHFSRTPQSQREGVSLSSYTGISRVGPGELQVHGSLFLIDSANVRYTYPAEELDQLLFEENGLALIPKNTRQPAAIFLSDGIMKVQSYVKSHAQFSPVA